MASVARTVDSVLVRQRAMKAARPSTSVSKRESTR